MRRSNEDSSEEVGSDSFLDIVSNFVGVLIILVMVTGAKIKNAILELNEPATGHSSQNDDALAARRNETLRLASNVEEVVRSTADVERRIELTQRQRAELATLIRAAELELDQHRQTMSAGDRQALDLARDLARLQSQDDELKRRQLSAVTQAPPDVKVESFPTPLSKQVFSHEEHYRLRAGRLTRVPFNELKDSLLKERRQLVWQLRDLPEVTGSVGPIDGFKLEYRIVRTATSAELDEAYCVPVDSELGVRLDEALASQSEFRRQLERFDRAGTTITVWTYSDSFEQFRNLKRELYNLGFAVAGRPLNPDSRIGFSPRGTPSAAQ